MFHVLRWIKDEIFDPALQFSCLWLEKYFKLYYYSDAIYSFIKFWCLARWNY